MHVRCFDCAQAISPNLLTKSTDVVGLAATRKLTAAASPVSPTKDQISASCAPANTSYPVAGTVPASPVNSLTWRISAAFEPEPSNQHQISGITRRYVQIHMFISRQLSDRTHRSGTGEQLSSLDRHVRLIDI